MPSVSLTRWRTDRRAALDAVEAAHAAVHGTGAGRREALRQISHGYAVLLAAEFQGYCRELHTEAVSYFVDGRPAGVRDVIAVEFTFARQLDRGNANSSSIGSDYGRLGLEWWRAVDRIGPTGPDLRRRLDELNAWRNAVAHNDFDPRRLGGTMVLRLAMVREWRRACDQLVRAFDAVLADHLEACTGHRPW